jgi:hypothetical protein
MFRFMTLSGFDSVPQPNVKRVGEQFEAKGVMLIGDGDRSDRVAPMHGIGILRNTANNAAHSID